MKIILTNGAELNPIMITGGPRYIQGSNRDTLNFIFPADAGMEALDETFIAENCESIIIVENNGNENIHKGYTIRAELSKASVKVVSETSETAAVYEDRITVSMSQRTYMESQLAAMQAVIDQMNI